MTIEKSHGKPRPTLPRSKALTPVERPRERNRTRDANGRVGVGNELAKGRGWKRAIKRSLEAEGDELPATAVALAVDAQRLFRAHLSELPHDGSLVRARVRSLCLHEALEGYYTAQALRLLGSPEGRAAEDRAAYHAQRAERLSVTALDIATAQAAAKPNAPALPPFVYRTLPESTAQAVHGRGDAAAAPAGHRRRERPAARRVEPSPPAIEARSNPVPQTELTYATSPAHPILCDALAAYAGLFDVDALARIAPEHRGSAIRAEAKAANARGQLSHAVLLVARGQGWTSTTTKGVDT